MNRVTTLHWQYLLVALLLSFIPITLQIVKADPVVIQDSQGEQRFDTSPKRVVALSWSQVEQVLDLDITPVGIADTDGYRAWVEAPQLPDSVNNVGLRQEPNLERIAELAPDVILISDDQIDFASKLERIAPVVHVDAYSEDHDNATVARENYQMLAALFDRQSLANTRLSELDNRINKLAQSIDAHFAGNLPDVTIVRFLDKSRAAIYGPNSMTSYALDAFGINSAFDVANSTWGLEIHKVSDLGAVDRGIVMHIQPFEQADQLFETALWNSMPFVDGDRFHTLPTLWTYGGALSVGRIADAIAATLLSVEPADSQSSGD